MLNFLSMVYIAQANIREVFEQTISIAITHNIWYLVALISSS